MTNQFQSYTQQIELMIQRTLAEEGFERFREPTRRTVRVGLHEQPSTDSESWAGRPVSETGP